jgi:hypothetical protein
VNLSLIKAELMHARNKRDGLPLRESILSNVDLLGKIGCAIPALANWFLDSTPVRIAMEKALGLSAQRSLPHYAKERLITGLEGALLPRSTPAATSGVPSFFGTTRLYATTNHT